MAQYPFDYNEVRQLTVKQVFHILDDWMNTFNARSPKEFNQCLMETHRTLQQTMVKFMFQVLYEYGKKSEYPDGRNEQAVNACKWLASKVDAEEIKINFPLI